MNNLYVITVAYCRSAQLAYCLMNFKSRIIDSHYFVQGHYPIDAERNNKEIELIFDSYRRRMSLEATNCEFHDPGGNIGSAQSQNWMLKKIELKDDDYWINLDPDSICHSNWIEDAIYVLDHQPECAFVSCNSPMVQSFTKVRGIFPIQPPDENLTSKVGMAHRPTPFNLTMWRGKFIREIGEFTQMGPWWGELEGMMYSHCQRLHYYHAYLLDHMEDESGKYFHPSTNADWKTKHMRTIGPEQFVGNYEEYLKYFHPHLIDLKL